MSGRGIGWLPKAALGLVREASRHLLRRPVVGICAVAQNDAGEVLLVRRGDNGGWALPGGTLEWGEQLALALSREIEEETGAASFDYKRVSGVYSAPERDPRFHAVTVCVLAAASGPLAGPKNRLEIREARFFPQADLPKLELGMGDMLADALAGTETVLE